MNFNDIIKKTPEEIEEYLTPEKIKEYKLDNLQVERLILATGDIDKYITPEILQALNLYSSQVVELIRATGNIEKYLTLDIIHAAKLSSSQVVSLIASAGKKKEFLDNPEKIVEFGIDNYGIRSLIGLTGEVEKYLFKGQTVGYKCLTIANVIKGLGKEKIEEYLTPEKLIKLGIADDLNIGSLLREIENPEKFLFEWQSVNDFNLNISNIIKGLGKEKIKEYLTVETMLDYLEAQIISEIDINNLIKATGNIEQYLFEGQNDKSQLDLSNVIKGMNVCPYLNQDDVKLLCSFGKETILDVIKLEKDKQKDAILILDSLSRSNSAELRRIKVPIAMQILDKDPEQYQEKLKEIVDLYLTNDIPTVGKLYLVFQELHPNLLGEENSRFKDESSGSIPSLENTSSQERKHIIFSRLLRCTMESNNRNIREYLDNIEQGNILYEQILSGELKIDELSKDDIRIETLSRYCSILNTLYNVTSKGKRAETARKNSGNIEQDLRELDKLFNEDGISMNLPDRIVRMFGYGTGIRTFEQAKYILENSRQNAHNRNVKLAESGKIDLKAGDFVKGIQATEYFPSMLQRGILAKDFLGGNATHDATPLDTDVEKVLEEGSNFKETLNGLEIAPSFTYCGVEGKKLGTIMLVFSGDDFIETRDSSYKVSPENIATLKRDKTKKEVFFSEYSIYGISIGIGSSNIKCIIADRYVDKLGLEIAKNGFYIPIVDREGNVIYTEKMYNEFREKMQGLSYYGETEFIVDETAKNNETEQISELIERNIQNARNKRNKILSTLEEAVRTSGYKLREGRSTDLTPGTIDFIDTGSTGRGTNAPGDGDFDFMVKIDKSLSDDPNSFKAELRKVLSKIQRPKDNTETDRGDFRYKGVKIEGLEQEVDIDLSFTEKTDEIEYSTDECIRDRLETIRNQSEEDYKYVVANILLAKNFLKREKVYKKADAPDSEPGEPDTRGGLGAAGIENWILQNNGSFVKAAESFLSVANECKSFEEFKSKYAIWDFGENHVSKEKGIYPHDNFVYNMSEIGYNRMKMALTKYIETIKKTNQNKIRIASLVAQDTSVLLDPSYMEAVKDIMSRGSKLARA